jgi:hypothetical protein
LTTKPDCASRRSTLQIAHWPVRGQAEAGVPLAVPAGFVPVAVPAAGTAGLTELEAVVVEESDAAFPDPDRVHAARLAVARRIKHEVFVIVSKDRDTAQAPRLLIREESTGGQMSAIQGLRRGAAAALMFASLGACAGSQLGNILGGVGGGTQSGQLSGTIRGVDTRYQQISIQQSNGQTVPVSYDNQTQVVYQNQNYPPTSLENGDQVTARVQANGNTYYTDYVQVDRSVTTNNGGSSNLQLVQGTVRQIDRRNGLFTIDINNTRTLTVTVPNNVSTNDVNRFNNLRSGDLVRFYGTFLNNSQIQLRQFN